jgi:hypothetical protein
MVKLLDGETPESEIPMWSRHARAGESYVAQLPEGSPERRRMQANLNYVCWVLGQLEEMAGVT